MEAHNSKLVKKNKQLLAAAHSARVAAAAVLQCALEANETGCCALEASKTSSARVASETSSAMADETNCGRMEDKRAVEATNGAVGANKRTVAFDKQNTSLGDIRASAADTRQSGCSATKVARHHSESVANPAHGGQSLHQRLIAARNNWHDFSPGETGHTPGDIQQSDCSSSVTHDTITGDSEEEATCNEHTEYTKNKEEEQKMEKKEKKEERMKGREGVKKEKVVEKQTQMQVRHELVVVQ